MLQVPSPAWPLQALHIDFMVSIEAAAFAPTAATNYETQQLVLGISVRGGVY